MAQQKKKVVELMSPGAAALGGRRIPHQINFNPEERTILDNARGKTSFSEFVRDAALDAAKRLLGK